MGEDGTKALDRALGNSPDLIILDTAVPVLGSAQLVNVLRNNQRTVNAMIFFVGQEGEDLPGFRESTDRFIPKPFNTEQLLIEIRLIFRRKSAKLSSAGPKRGRRRPSADQLV